MKTLKQGKQCDFIEEELNNVVMERMEQDAETVEYCINLVKEERPGETGMRYKDIKSTRPSHRKGWNRNITESTEIKKSGTRHYVCV